MHLCDYRFSYIPVYHEKDSKDMLNVHFLVINLQNLVDMLKERYNKWLRAELSATHCANSDIIDFVQSVANVEKMVM